MTAATSLDLSFLAELGLEGPQSGAYAGHWLECTGSELVVTTPATGEVIPADLPREPKPAKV